MIHKSDIDGTSLKKNFSTEKVKSKQNNLFYCS